jgi:hypothetical protein
MLVASFFSENRAYVCVRSERGVKKKFIFFLSSFPERMFREVNGRSFHPIHAARDLKSVK